MLFIYFIPNSEIENNFCNFCFFQDKSKDSKANPLSVKNIGKCRIDEIVHNNCNKIVSSRPFWGGVFVVLLGGLLVAIIVAVLEFCWNSRKNSQIDRQSLCSEMAEELRYYYDLIKDFWYHTIMFPYIFQFLSHISYIGEIFCYNNNWIYIFGIRFAMRCHGSRQKPALRRSCSRCSPDNT